MALTSATNMYRVGDYVYFEINSSAPFQIRRIEELNKTINGNVEAKVMCFYRRRDISSALTKIFEDRPSVTAAQNQTNNSTAEPKSDAKPDEDKTEPQNNDTEEKVDDVAEKEKVDDVAEKEKVDDVAEEEIVDDVAEKEKVDDIAEKEKVDDVAEKEKVDDVAEKEKVDDVAEKEKVDDVAEKEKIDDEIKMEVDEDKKAATPSKTNQPEETSSKTSDTNNVTAKTTVRMPGEELLSDSQKHQLLHHELFLSRQIETLPATHIRGKCSVTLLNEIETPESYLNHEDMFFYSLVYDPAQKTLIADKGEIRIGEKYQAEVYDMILEEEQERYRTNVILETPIYVPYHSLTDRQIDQYIVIARAVGTFARALDMSSSAKQPNLHLTAAAASRDITPFQALAMLHHANYDLSKAVEFLVPPAQKQCYPLDVDRATSLHTATLGGPLMCRDQLEEWSAAEANLFDEALEKYGKDFNDIRQDFLPWKSLRDIVEYYYMWKTTDRYVQQKRAKAGEAESRLKQVYIPTYTKPNPNVLNATSAVMLAQVSKCCESCLTENTEQWYSWGPSGSFLRLCRECWTYWKKFGGLKKAHDLENFDKTVYQNTEHITSTLPRASDRLESFDASIRRCTIGGCGRQFASIQLLNQHMRRDHFIGGGPIPNRDGVSPYMGGAGVYNNAAPVSGGPHGPYYHGGPMRPGGPRTHTSFLMRSTLMIKVARRLTPKSLLNGRRAARHPFDPINLTAVRQHYASLPSGAVRTAMRAFVKHTAPIAAVQAKSTPTATVKSAQPAKPAVAAPVPVQPVSGLPQKRTQNGQSWVANTASPPKKTKAADGSVQVSPAIERGDTLFLKWIRTPDDCYFHATKKTKSLRRPLKITDVRKAGRRPYKTPVFVQQVVSKIH